MNNTSYENITFFDCPYSPLTVVQVQYTKGIATVNCLLSLLIIFGNTLVLLSIFTNERLRTKCNFFLISLASADMLVGLVDIPIWTYVLFNTFNVSQIFTFVFTLFDVLLGIASMMSLLALSIARCYSVIKPFSFHAQRDKGYAIAAAVFPWGMAGIGCVVMYYLNEVDKDRSGSYMAVFYFLPLLFILPAYGIMFKEGYKLAKVSSHQLCVKEDLRAAKTAGIIIFCFLITWLPFFLFQILIAVLNTSQCADDSPLIWGIPALKLLQHSHSAINPVIYGARNKEFRRTFIRILRRNCVYTRESLYASTELRSTVMYSAADKSPCTKARS